MVGLGQSFRWIARAVKTILHIGLLCFYEIMSLQRNVGSQPSNCHFRPVWDLDFWMPKHFQPCIVRDRHGYHRVRKHRINYNAFISDSYRRILTMVTTKNRLRSLFREEREKWGLKVSKLGVLFKFYRPYLSQGHRSRMWMLGPLRLPRRTRPRCFFVIWSCSAY